MKTRHFLTLAATIAAICLVNADSALAQQPETIAPPATLEEAVGERAAPEPAPPATMDPAAIKAMQRVRLFDAAEAPSSQLRSSSSDSDVRKSKMSAAELRQARALYRSQQRIARLEYNLWMGHEPLRPSWNPLPMMSSRYPNRQIYVPVYIRSRR